MAGEGRSILPPEHGAREFSTVRVGDLKKHVVSANLFVGIVVETWLRPPVRCGFRLDKYVET
jgi:hypothetical protein